MGSMRALLLGMLLSTLVFAGCGSDGGGTGPGDDGEPVPVPERLEFEQVSRDPLSNNLREVTARNGVGLAISQDGMVAVRKGPAQEWFSPERFTLEGEPFLAAHITASGALLATSLDRIYRAKAPGADWTEVFEQNLGGLVSLASDEKTVIATGQGIFRSADEGATWEEIDEEFVGVFGHVASLGSGVFLILAQDGTLLRSDDDGLNWDILGANPPVGFFAGSMEFLDDQRGIVVEANSPSTTLVTDTGGKSWEEVPGVGQVRDLSALSSGFVVALRSNTQLHVSSDGGRSFSAGIPSDRTLLERPEAVHAITPTNWLLVGADGVIVETLDGGASWQPRTRGLVRDLCELAVSEDGVVVAITGSCDFSIFESALAVSTDAGRNFTVLEDVAGPNALQRVVFRGNRGLVLAREGAVSTSTDGGRTWAPARQVASTRLTDATFVDDQTLLVTGSSGAVLRSIDGGTSFTEIFDTGTFNGRIVNFPRTSTVVLTGSVVMRSTDLGDTWSVVDMRGIRPPRELATLTATTAFGISGESDLVRTDDSGSSWQSVLSLVDVRLLRLVFATPLHGLLLTSEGVMQTLDGGETWETQPLSTGLELLSLAMDESGGAWVGGINGQLFEGVAP